MYTIVRTMGRRIGSPAQITQIDISQVSFVTLSQYFYDVYFIITVNNDPQEKVLYLSELSNQTQISDVLITDWFQRLGNQALPLGDELPLHLKGEVYRWDGLSHGFNTTSYKYGVHPRSRMLEEDKTDLLLTHPDVDYDHATLHSLVSINGLFHYHEDSEHGWVLVDGNKTRNKQRDRTQINILDFTQVGEVHRYRITEKMIRPVREGVKLSEQFYIDIEESLLGKTVGIVIGGYFHLLDHTYKQVSDHRIKISWENLQWETLYFKMREILDIDLPITPYGNEDDVRILDMELYHDEVIKAVLTHPCSFIVVIYNPYISVDYIPVGHMGIPKRYESGIPPVYPLRIGEGRYPAFHAIKEVDKWSLAVDDDIVRYPTRYQKPKHDTWMIHNAYPPVMGEGYAPAHYVRISSDKNLTTKLLDNLFDSMTHTIGSILPYCQKMTHDTLPYRGFGENDFYFPPLILNENFHDPYYTCHQLPFPYTQ